MRPELFYFNIIFLPGELADGAGERIRRRTAEQRRQKCREDAARAETSRTLSMIAAVIKIISRMRLTLEIPSVGLYPCSQFLIAVDFRARRRQGGAA